MRSDWRSLLFVVAGSLAASATLVQFAVGGGARDGGVAPSPGGSAVRGIPQNHPLFMPAHEDLLKKRTQGVIDIYFLGDSITRRWHGNDYPRHQKVWNANFHGWNAANFGWGMDGTQNTLWRIENGELDGVNPKVVVLLAGANNVGGVAPPDVDAKADEVAAGIKAILEVVREKAPDAKVVLMGVTARNEKGSTAVMPTIGAINERLATFADGESVIFLNINDKLADADGKLFDGVTEDGLHLSTKGYQIWADALKPLFTEWLGPPADEDRAPPATGIPEVPAANGG